MKKVFLRELRRICTRPIYLFCMIVVPLFCTWLLTSLMDEGLPSEMPVGMVDMDNSVTTRSLASNLDAFQNTRIVERYASPAEATAAMRRGEIYAFYYVPEGTTRKLLRQEAPKVSFYTNNAYLMAGSLLYKDMRTMSELMGGAAARSVLFAKGATNGQAMAFLQPIVIDAHAIGNPVLNYNIYLSNVLLPGMLSLMIFFITVFSIGQEIKEGGGRALLILSNGSPFKALYAKLAAQFVIFALVGVCIGLYLYGVPAFGTEFRFPVGRDLVQHLRHVVPGHGHVSRIARTVVPLPAALLLSALCALRARRLLAHRSSSFGGCAGGVRPAAATLCGTFPPHHGANGLCTLKSQRHEQSIQTRAA